MRSMGTINHTKINFTMMELLHMISRVEIQNDIVYNRLANIAKFPRISINELAENTITMPSNEEVATSIQRALKDSIECAAKFGISCNEPDIQICDSKKKTIPNNKNVNEEDMDTSDDDLEDLFTNRDENINLKGFDVDDLSENSKYIQISNPDGTSKIVLKSSIVSLLSDEPQKLSNYTSITLFLIFLLYFYLVFIHISKCSDWNITLHHP